jgi:prephenate dehydratase
MTSMSEHPPIALKGRRGSFTQQIVSLIFPGKRELIFCDEFSSIFDAVVTHGAIGVTPIENTLGGSILESYDLFCEYDVHITAEHLLRVEHHLLGHCLDKDETVTERLSICTEVSSHPQGLRQTARFLKNFPHITQKNMLSTSEAAEYVGNSQRKDMLAIASEEAASLYNLCILQKNIEDNPRNYTRFVVLEQGPVPRAKKECSHKVKCSISVQLAHEPGSLVTFLRLLQDIQANLTKLESRPIPGKPFHYCFTIDFEVGSIDSQKIDTLRDNAATFQLHGVYLPAKNQH